MSTNNHLLTVPQLIEYMTGSTFTDGWDMACSYGVDQLNKELATLYSANNSKIVKTISLGSQDQPYSMTYTIVHVPNVFDGLSLSITENYAFQLQQPALEFLAVTNTAALDMPIMSATVTTTDATLKSLHPQPANAAQINQNNRWYKLVGDQFQLATVDEVNAAINRTGDPSQDPKYDAIAQQFYIRAQSPSLDGQNGYQGLVFQLQHIQAEDPKPALAANSYVLRAIVPLVSVIGSNQPTPGGQVVTFDASGDKAHVVLHFQSGGGSGTTYGLYQGGVQAMPDLLKTAPDILYQIQNFFAQQVGEIDYLLTTIDSQPAGSSGILLKPKSFCFASQTVGSTGVLTVFIQTAESGLPVGGSNLTFQRLGGGGPFLPVTSAANTTLIYSRGFMSRYYMVQGLQKAGFRSVANSGTDATPVAVTATFPASGNINITGISVPTYDSVTVDPVPIGDIALQLSFDDGNKLNISAQMARSTKIHLTWTPPPPPCGISFPQHRDEDATINVTLGKTVPLQWTESGDNLSLTFAISSSDYHVAVDSSISTECDDKTKGEVDSQIQTQVAASLPSISIPMTSLSALAAVNLLFSGESVFVTDTALGVYSPHDVVLFGNI